MVELADFVQVLNATSAVAVLLGVVFVVFQLRQNARVIKASNEQVQARILQNKSSIATSVVERFTDDYFTVRRKTVRDIIRKYQDVNWEGFPESAEDFEVRVFGSHYEFTAYLAREGIIDIHLGQSVLGHRVTFDWEVLRPAAEHYGKAWGKRYIFANFEWLAGESEKYLAEVERAMMPSPTTKAAAE